MFLLEILQKIGQILLTNRFSCLRLVIANLVEIAWYWQIATKLSLAPAIGMQSEEN